MIGSIGTTAYAGWTDEAKASTTYVVVFETSSDKILNFNDFTRQSSTRTVDHEILLKKPKTEFLGPNLDTISFTIRLSSMYGVKPLEEMNKLLILQRAGTPVTLTIGEKGIGVNKWTIEELEQGWNTIDNQGNLIEAELSITLKEYT